MDTEEKIFWYIYWKKTYATILYYKKFEKLDKDISENDINLFDTNFTEQHGNIFDVQFSLHSDFFNDPIYNIIEMLEENKSYKDFFEYYKDDIKSYKESYAIRYIGAENIVLKNGYFNGKLITEIDFSLPIDVIFNEIKRIKEKKFNKIPNYVELKSYINSSDQYENVVLSLIGKKNLIVRDTIPRAVGLYLWGKKNFPFSRDDSKPLSDIINTFFEDEDFKYITQDLIDADKVRSWVEYTGKCIAAGDVLPFHR